MEIVATILVILIYCLIAVFVAVPLLSWWIQLIKMRKIKKSLSDSGGIDLNALSKHIK